MKNHYFWIHKIKNTYSRLDLTNHNSMKKALYITTIILFAIGFSSCGGNKEKKKGEMSFVIEGTFEDAAGKMLYIEEMTADNGAQFCDSIPCDSKGHFKYEGHMTYQTFYNLHCSEYDYIVLLPNDGEKVELSGKFGQLGVTYLVNGSPESRLMWQIQSYINEANDVIAGIAQQDKHNKSTLSEAEYQRAHEVTDSIFISERNLIHQMFLNFITDNSGSLSTLYALDAPFDHKYRVFYAESDFEVFEQVLEGLNEKIPDNPHTQYFRTRVERARSERALAQQQQQPGQEIIIE